jgi:tetratricopeptide (TPR) repeat protein
MKKTRTRVQRGRNKRRWHIPPPLLHGSEALEGGQLLRELPGESGVVLWQALRDVMLWAQTPVLERGGLFAEGAHERRMASLLEAAPAGTQESLKQIVDLVEDPEAMQVETVSLACRQLAQWAEQQGRPATALAFAQDAALAMPGDPAASFAVGRLAEVAGDPARAEVWYRRTIGLARQAREWRLYSRSFLALGRLARSRENPAGARYQLIRALRGARRGGMRQEQAWALHELFLLSASTGREEEADRMAVAAFEAYGARSPRLTEFARDLAVEWSRQGRAEHAEPIWKTLGERSPLRAVAEPPRLPAAAEKAAVALASSLVRTLESAAAPAG